MCPTEVELPLPTDPPEELLEEIMDLLRSISDATGRQERLREDLNKRQVAALFPELNTLWRIKAASDLLRDKGIPIRGESYNAYRASVDPVDYMLACNEAVGSPWGEASRTAPSHHLQPLQEISAMMVIECGVNFIRFLAYSLRYGALSARDALEMSEQAAALERASLLLRLDRANERAIGMANAVKRKGYRKVTRGQIERIAEEVLDSPVASYLRRKSGAINRTLLAQEVSNRLPQGTDSSPGTLKRELPEIIRRRGWDKTG